MNKLIPLSEYFIGETVCFKNKIGNVTKISESAVHVKYLDGYFEKFHFNSKHHMHTSIKELQHGVTPSALKIIGKK